MSFLLPLAILSLSAAAAPVPDRAPNLDLGVEIPTLSSGAHTSSWASYSPTLLPKTSLVSSTSVTDSLSFTGTGLDTGLSSTLQGLATANSALDSNLGAWLSSDDLVSYLCADTPNMAIPATGLVVRAGEDPEAWVSIPEGEASSQAVADLESSSWILLNDLISGLTADAFIPVQSALAYQSDESSDAVAYVSLEDHDATLGALPLDHTLDCFLYTDIVGVSSDLGLGNGLDADTLPTENLPSDPHLDASTQVGSETDLLVSYDGLETNTNIAVDSTSDLLTSASSSLNLDTDLADDSLSSYVDVDIASRPEPSSPSDFGVSVC